MSGQRFERTIRERLRRLRGRGRRESRPLRVLSPLRDKVYNSQCVRGCLLRYVSEMRIRRHKRCSVRFSESQVRSVRCRQLVVSHVPRRQVAHRQEVRVSLGHDFNRDASVRPVAEHQANRLHPGAILLEDLLTPSVVDGLGETRVRRLVVQLTIGDVSQRPKGFLHSQQGNQNACLTREQFAYKLGGLRVECVSPNRSAHKHIRIQIHRGINSSSRCPSRVPHRAQIGRLPDLRYRAYLVHIQVWTAGNRTNVADERLEYGWCHAAPELLQVDPPVSLFELVPANQNPWCDDDRSQPSSAQRFSLFYDLWLSEA